VEAYNRYNVFHFSFLFLCAPMVQGNMTGQYPFDIHRQGAGSFEPSEVDYNEPYRTAKQVRADFDAWLTKTGWPYVEEQRKGAPGRSWVSQLAIPDRTPRAVSAIPVGNDVVVEFITTWSEDGALKEGAWTSVLTYQQDGTVAMERMYADPANWPIPSSQKADLPEPSPDRSKGAMDGYYDFHRGLQIEVAHSALEKRNLSLIEGAWLDAQNTDLDMKVFHPDRFRMQWPNQGCSFNLDILKEVETIAREAAPDKETRLGMTYAKGNQVVAECVVSWTDDGVAKEVPFISFLLLDADGLVIRERRYFSAMKWPGAGAMTYPGAEKIAARL